MADQPGVLFSPPPTGALTGSMEICQLIARSHDWKATLDQIIPFARRQVIFDNFVIYQRNPTEDPSNISFEVIYARAIGRGKSLGEFISWGDATASRVFDSGHIIVNQPIDSGTAPADGSGRLDLPFILGIPFALERRQYVAILVRFGGPEYTTGDKQTAAYLACQITLLLKQQQFRDQLLDLEKEREQFVLQEDFISTISHELLSPIGFIKGYTTTLMRPDTKWNPEMQQEFLTVIDEETDRLQELIDNLLDSSRLQSGTLSMDHQPVRLDTLLRDVVMRTKARQTNLTMKLDIQPDLPAILGDSRRLTQVIENIIGNAIKYAPGSTLLVRAYLQGRKIHMVFSDDGPGISNRYLPSLFKKFYRNPESSTSTHGTGLGLYICRQIIQAHDGEISAESELGKGLTIHTILPLPEPGFKEKL